MWTRGQRVLAGSPVRRHVALVCCWHDVRAVLPYRVWCAGRWLGEPGWAGPARFGAATATLVRRLQRLKTRPKCHKMCAEKTFEAACGDAPGICCSLLGRLPRRSYGYKYIAKLRYTFNGFKQPLDAAGATSQRHGRASVRTGKIFGGMQPAV